LELLVLVNELGGFDWVCRFLENVIFGVEDS
jgi:hypothetical protein